MNTMKNHSVKPALINAAGISGGFVAAVTIMIYQTYYFSYSPSSFFWFITIMGLASLLMIYLSFRLESDNTQGLIAKILNMKFEILGILFALAIIYSLFGYQFFFSFTYKSLFLSGRDIAELVILFGYYWIYFFFVYLAVGYVKKISRIGITRFFSERSIIIAYFERFGLDRLSDRGTSAKMIIVNSYLLLLCFVFAGIFLRGQSTIETCYIFIAVIVADVLLLYEHLYNYHHEINIIEQQLAKIAHGDFGIVKRDDLVYLCDLEKSIADINIGFKKAIKEEIKSQSMKTELISNVSHDLKTPITGISNYIELLQNDDLASEDRIKYIDLIDHYNERLNKLVNDLFEISKAASGNIVLNRQTIDLIALIKQVIVECEDKFSAKKLKLVEHYGHEAVMADLDVDKTYRIFENLFINISKYALSNTRVYIDVVVSDDRVQIELKNIAQDEMNFSKEEIQERFVRGDKSRHESGSGLGLAICKSFSEIQGGTFDIAIDGDLFKAIICFSIV